MTTDNFTEAARAEAEGRYNRTVRRNKTADEWLDEGRASGFASGAEWARTHLASQEPTDAEIEAAAKSLWAEIWLNPELHPWDTEATGAERASCRREARAALSAARAARRDEEKQ